MNNVIIKEKELTMKRSSPLVSIITVNYNQSEATCALLESLNRLDYDTEIEPDTVSTLVGFFAYTPDTGIASPKITYFGTAGAVQYAGSYGINRWTCRSTTIGHLDTDRGQYDSNYTRPIIDDAAIMVPKRGVDIVGTMPELFFLYYEKLDWREMIKQSGFKSYYVGKSTVYDKGSLSVGKFSVTKTYYMNRNRLLFIRRNYTGITALTSSLFFIFVALPKNMIVNVMSWKWKHVKAWWSGLLWGLRTSRRVIVN